jgi:SNF2 family DNA or RNA helicase
MNLYPFQEEGVTFLGGKDRAYLADEMGLGKTVQAIVAAENCLWDDSEVVVVCPASVVENWKREWDEWGGGIHQLHVISYSKLIRPAHRAKLPTHPDLVIFDEAHYLKSVGAKRTKVALSYAKSTAGRVWCLSGTPMPNDPRELFAVMRHLWPELLEELNTTSLFRFMDRFCVWSENEWGYRVWGLKPEAKTELVPALRTFMLRRKLTDVALDLPPLRFTVERLPQDKELADKLRELGADMESDEESLSTLRRVLGEYKAPVIAEKLVEELNADPDLNMVVLYHHHKTADKLGLPLLDAVGKDQIWGYDGSCSSAEREYEIRQFQKKGRVFLAQQTAAGVGITLTRASEIVLVEPSWSPEDNQQAIKRIHRIGQDRPCRARLFSVPGSLDDALMSALARKQGMIEEVLND